LVLPTTTEKAGFSPRTLEEEVVPLLRQAAEEAEVATIPLESSPSIGEQLAEAVVDFSATKARWHLVSADSEETDEGPAGNAIDGKLSTYWHTRYSPKPDRYPHQLVVDMAEATQIAGFRYVPRQDGGTNGRVKRFSFYTSLDGSGWGEAAVTGTLPNTSQATIVRFSAPIRARFFKFVALSEQNNQPYASAAEIDVVPAP
jgi:beta-galactosidase